MCLLELIALVNQVVNAVFGWLMVPLRWMDPRLALLVISVLSGLLMLWAYKKYSNQDAIRRYKDKIRGNLLGVRLYQHDVRIVLRLQGVILRDTLKYIGHSFAPVLVLIVPITLIIIQLNYFFDLRPLEPERTTLIQARFDPEKISVLDQPISLQGAGMVVETPPVRIRQQGEVWWRVRFTQPGQFDVNLLVGADSFAKRIEVGEGWRAISRMRTRDALDLLLYPGEAPLPSPLEAIEVRYQTLPLTVWGWHVHWLVAFFLLSIAAAFLLKGLFGVEL